MAPYPGQPQWHFPGEDELQSEELALPLAEGRRGHQTLPHQKTGRWWLLHRQQTDIPDTKGKMEFVTYMCVCWVDYEEVQGTFHYGLVDDSMLAQHTYVYCIAGEWSPVL